jgi:hypothetical protein
VVAAEHEKRKGQKNMGVFAGANKAALTGKRSPKLRKFLGKHELELSNFKTAVSKNKDTMNQDYAVAEFKVIRSTNPALTPGQIVAWTRFKNPQWPDYFFSDIKCLIGALTGKDPESITEKKMELVAAGKANGKRLIADVASDGEYNTEEFSTPKGDELFTQVANEDQPKAEKSPKPAAGKKTSKPPVEELDEAADDDADDFDGFDDDAANGDEEDDGDDL